MRHVPLLAAIALVLIATQSPAFDAVGHIKKVDAEKNLLSIHANGQDRTVKIDKEAKVLGADGKPLADGLKSKELKEGAEVTVTVERPGDK
jgi:Cu/Ag efflux protein CusF